MLKQERQYSCKHNIKVLSRHHCCRQRAVSITCSECVPVALIILHTMRMRRNVSSSVACLAVHFSTLSYKQHYFREKSC